MLLLLLDKPSELKGLERDGAFQPIAPGRYWLKDLIQGYVRHQREHRFDVETNMLANCWMVSAARVKQLAHEGWFKPLDVGRGKYNLIEACTGFVKYLRAEDRRSTRSAADARIKDAKAQDIETRTKQRLGRLIPLEVYEEMIDNMSGVVRSEFAGLAAASTRDLTMRRVIEREVNARLRRIAEHAMAQAIRLEASGGADDAVRANGARHLGGEQQDVPTNGGGAGAT
jgi:hypothetical protein